MGGGATCQAKGRYADGSDSSASMGSSDSSRSRSSPSAAARALRLASIVAIRSLESAYTQSIDRNSEKIDKIANLLDGILSSFKVCKLKLLRVSFRQVGYT